MDAATLPSLDWLIDWLTEWLTHCLVTDLLVHGYDDNEGGRHEGPATADAGPQVEPGKVKHIHTEQTRTVRSVGLQEIVIIFYNTVRTFDWTVY